MVTDLAVTAPRGAQVRPNVVFDARDASKLDPERDRSLALESEAPKVGV
jgi:hypothetical protein